MSVKLSYRSLCDESRNFGRKEGKCRFQVPNQQMYHTVFSNKMTRITMSKTLPHNTKDMGVSFQ